MERKILIYDKGKLLGSVEDNEDIPQDTILCLFDTTLNGKHLEVLHVLDMDYGIVMPAHIAKKMNAILLEKEGSDVK
jgi:hypothetical protein